MPSGVEAPTTSLPDARLLLSMADADIEKHVLRDVLHSDAGEPSRWTGAHPAFRLLLDDVEGLQFYIHLFLPEPTFQVTGPVKLTVTINGTVVATPQFKGEGDHEFQCVIPNGLLKRKEPATVSMDVHPPYVSPRDGTRLGVLLFAVGFRKPGT